MRKKASTIAFVNATARLRRGVKESCENLSNVQQYSMLKASDQSAGNTIIFEGQFRLTDEDYRRILIPRLEEIIRRHGKARLLLDLGERFEGWELKAIWDDVSFGLAHRREFEKMGVITDRRWIHWGLRAGRCLFTGELKTYSPNQRTEAYEWINS